MENLFGNRQKSFLVASPIEDEKIARSKSVTEESVRAGAKAAAIAFVASAIPTVIVARKVPWAKAHLNYTAQAMIVSAASIAAYFIAADKTIMAFAKRNAHTGQINK